MKRALRLTVVAVLAGLLQVQTGAAQADSADDYSITATIPLPGEPNTVVVDSAARRAFVTDVPGNAVDVVSTASDQVVASYPVGAQPYGIALDPAADRLYVANNGSGSVSVLVASTGQPVATVEGLSFPDGVALDPGVGKLFVATGDFLTTIDTTTFEVVDTVQIGAEVTAVAVDTGTHRAFATAAGSGVVGVVDTETGSLVATVEVQGRPVRVAVDPVAHRAYVVAQTALAIAVIDTTTSLRLGYVLVGFWSSAVGVDETTHVVYVGNRSSESVSVIDGTQGLGVEIDRVTGMHGPSGIGVDTTTHAAYVANASGSPSLEKVAVETRQRQTITFTTSAPPQPLAGSVYVVQARGGGSGNRVLFTTQGSCTILNSNAARAKVRFDRAGFCQVDADQAGNEEYVAAPTASQVIFPVARPQTIGFTTVPPDPALVGSVYVVRAHGGPSGNRVVFTASGVCSVIASNRVRAKVRFDRPGSCEIDANQAGNEIYEQAPTTSQTFTVSAGQTPD